MSHDQLFKDLLRAFFADFLTLFLPDIAAGVDPTEIVFLDTQTFTDVPDGALRIADLVARVRTHTGAPAVVLLHTEIQAQRGVDLGQRMWGSNVALRHPAGQCGGRRHPGQRMWGSNVALRQRMDLPVLSVAVVLAPGTPGVSLER